MSTVRDLRLAPRRCRLGAGIPRTLRVTVSEERGDRRTRNALLCADRGQGDGMAQEAR
jgi:hypothetical protein